MLHDVNTGERPREAAAEGERPVYSHRPFMAPAPRALIPDGAMDPDVAYHLIADELQLDGKPKLNVASFVTTWMDDYANRLMDTAINKNLADQTEYPRTTDIAQRCVNMVGNLWHAEACEGQVTGTYAIGSSEAAMLGGVAMIRYWEENRRQDPSARPNIVMGTDVHVCWEKFANYFGVEFEKRQIPMRPGQYTITPEDVKQRVDENTIGVICVLGTTFTGQYMDVKAVNEALLEVKATKGWDIPIHVDGASGGFVAPFDRPELEWDFRLEQVRSINASGHKYGLVYPGIGWVIWRDKEYLPKSLLFSVNYLGGEEETFNLNFSRPAAQVIAQYYQFLRLGREGYTDLVAALRRSAVRLQDGLLKMGVFEALSRAHSDLPVVVVRLKPDVEARFDAFQLADKLRQKGWIVPAYTLPPNLDDGPDKTTVLRMVVREGFSVDMVDLLLADTETALKELEGEAKRQVHPKPTREGVKHKFAQC